MRPAANRAVAKVWVPPETACSLPVRPRPQTLPLDELPWEIFQRLCARLAQRCGDVEYCQEYGLPGQDQEGIDVYVRRKSTGRYAVWQCKRYQRATAAVIRSAIDDFMSGEWLTKAEEFVFCISAPMEDRQIADEIEAQSQRLRAHSVALTTLGVTQLSERLKEHPDLVDDFLGREWAREFCGDEAAQRLGNRILSPSDVSRLRDLLRHCYTQHFDVVDPGLPSPTSPVWSGPRPLALVERFVLPDVFETRHVIQAQPSVAGRPPEALSWPPPMASSRPPEVPRRAPEPYGLVTCSTEVRRPALEWLIENDLSVVIGDPGIGKSSLLRFLLLDLLSPQPVHEALAMKWGDRLPVWVPFAMWTRMVAETETTCSLQDVLTTWLHKVCAPDQLVVLVQQALKDSRLLLFVDGLDEWSNETAARSTVTLLEHFIGERAIPAVAASRPLGFERLGGLGGRWQRARLAGFTPDQQHDFASRWFLHQAQASHPGAQADDQDIHLADVRAADLVSDLQRDGRLSMLAEVPLLLSGLIALTVHSVQLPRNRFKAYEEMTRLLLQEQPRRREKAAHARTSSSQLNHETRERALASLAWAVHSAAGSDAVDRRSARQVLCDFLTTFLRKEEADALELADQIVAVGAEAIGILVEKSPQELGFVHRSFQEFLAARHLSTLSFGVQKERFAALFTNPQWHEVLLCLCYLTTRSGEVDALLGIVEEAHLPPDLEPARQAFLAQVVFGDLHSSASVASRLAANAFAQIEAGTWLPLRERLLEHALGGLHSDLLRAETENRVATWYPARHEYPANAYRAMAGWPPDRETLDALWRGLLNEEESNQRAAAEALATRFGRDAAVGGRLLKTVTTPAEVAVTTHLLHALCLGWPEEPALPEILRKAREVADWSLRIAAITHRVKRGEHDRLDRDALLHFASDRFAGGWRWQGDAVEAIVTGWPRDAQVKKTALTSVRRYFVGEPPMQSEFAGSLLLRGFQQDDEVAATIADLFRTEDYPQHSLVGLTADWTPFVCAFEGHALLVEAVDDWLEGRQERLLLDGQLCMISKSTRAKKLLTSPTEDTGVITEHQALWLLHGWGMTDVEAAQALAKFAESASAPRAAHLLPDMMSDKPACRRRLLGWLRTQGDHVGRLALLGLAKLGCDESDHEVVDAALEQFGGHVPCGVRWTGVRDVILLFPKDPRVRQLALHQIENRGGEINVVADVYKDDPQMRRAIVRHLTFLPSSLRIKVVDHLERHARTDQFAYSLLSQYDEDVGEAVKTAAAIAYARSARELPEDLSALIPQLFEGLRAVGPDLSERRQAAFAAVLELARLDIALEADQSQEGGVRHLGLGRSLSTNPRFAVHVAKNWGRVEESYGSAFWERVGPIPGEFLEEVARQVKDPNVLDQIVARADRSTGVSPSLVALRIRTRQWRGTERLRRLCTDLVATFRPSSWVHTAPGILAAETLSDQFAGDSATGEELERLADGVPNPTALIVALAGGWPTSEVLKRFSQSPPLGLLLPAQSHLVCRFADANQLVAWLATSLPRVTGNIWDFLPSWLLPILSRFGRDTEVRDRTFGRLEADVSAAEIGNLPSLLRRTDPRVDRLLAWCRDAVADQWSGDRLPNFALDIFSGRVRPIAHILLDLL